MIQPIVYSFTLLFIQTAAAQTAPTAPERMKDLPTLVSPDSPEQLKELAAINALMSQERASFRVKLYGDPRDTDSPGLIYLRDHPSRPGHISSIDEQQSNRKAAQMLLDAAYAEHKRIMDEVIDRTIRLYHIQPAQTDGYIVSGAFVNTKPIWQPTYAADTQNRVAMLPDGKKVALHAPRNEAVTWIDGSIELNDAALSRGPGYLAAIICHETIHYEQHTTVGVGDKITWGKAEIQAHSVSSSTQLARILGLSADDQKALFSSFRNQLNDFYNNPMSAVDGVQFAPSAGNGLPSPEPDKLSGDANFARGLGDLADLSKDAKPQALQEISASRADADRRNKDESDQDKQRWLDRQARADAVYKYIRATAKLACSDPQELRKQAGLGKVVVASIDFSDIQTRYDSDKDEVGWKSLSAKPNPCEIYIIDLIMRSDHLTTSEEIAAWAEQFRTQHPGLLKRLGASIGDFFSALDEFSQSSDESQEGSSQSAGSGEAAGNRSQSARPPANRTPPTSWSSLNQLRGLAGQ